MTTAQKAKPTLLRSEHFEGRRTQLAGTGLSFSSNIGPDEREMLTHFRGHTMRLMTKLDRVRPYTKVTLNPSRPSARTLSQLLSEAQKREMPNEHISISHGLPARYERAWRRGGAIENDSEGQQLVAVAYDPFKPVGYAGWRVALTHDAHDKGLFLSFSLDLVYVHPRRRLEGFGLDLAIACGMVCEDILYAIYRAVPPGTKIAPQISADYESKGGERFAMNLYDSLSNLAEDLSEFGTRRSVSFDQVELDAGY